MGNTILEKRKKEGRKERKKETQGVPRKEMNTSSNTM